MLVALPCAWLQPAVAQPRPRVRLERHRRPIAEPPNLGRGPRPRRDERPLGREPRLGVALGVEGPRRVVPAKVWSLVTRLPPLRGHPSQVAEPPVVGLTSHCGPPAQRSRRPRRHRFVRSLCDPGMKSCPLETTRVLAAPCPSRGQNRMSGALCDPLSMELVWSWRGDSNP